MSRVYICDYRRTPIGRYGGVLSGVRTDDLAAIPIKAILDNINNASVDWSELDEVILGCANQAGEDNRNVARMASLLAHLPVIVPAHTVNRLCASGMDAIVAAARAIRCGDAHLMIAGGVESMSRSPLVLPKASTAFERQTELYDTTIGWRFINPQMQELYGTDSMPETAENVAEQYEISREDQDAFAVASQQKTLSAQSSGRLAKEITAVTIAQRKGDALIIDTDEHPRATSLEKLAALRTPFRQPGTVTAGNASGVNDGSAALLLASEQALERYSLTPLACISGSASAGVSPEVMGIGPVPATEKLCRQLNIQTTDFDRIELNEAFAAQALAVLRQLGISETAAHVNSHGGAIALGHPLGMSGARIVGTAAIDIACTDASTALCTLCVGVGQGVALALESV